MEANSCLILKNYIVKAIHFSINEEFKPPENAPILIDPEYERRIRKIDDNSAFVNLIFTIKNGKNDLPFAIEVDIEGLFQLDNWEHPEINSIMTTNTIAILFPYLRSIVSMVTANANIPPYTIPVMNITAMFDDETIE